MGYFFIWKSLIGNREEKTEAKLETFYETSLQEYFIYGGQVSKFYEKIPSFVAYQVKVMKKS